MFGVEWYKCGKKVESSNGEGNFESPTIYWAYRSIYVALRQ